MVAARVRLHHTSIDGKTLTLDETCVHACSHYGLEYLPQQIAVPEASVAIDRERRMVRNLVIESEPTKPAIRQVKFDLLTQLALRANTIAVGNDQHAEHELRVDRRTTDVAVEGLKLLAHASEHAGDDRVDEA